MARDMDRNGNFISAASISNLYVSKEIWADFVDYKDEYAQILHAREKHQISFSHRAPQIQHRAHLVQHLKDAAVTLELTHCTLHLAVYIMDIFMDNHSIAHDRIMLLASCCMLIAAKVEECNAKTPRIAELNRLLPTPYAVNDYKLLEVLVLKYFDWSMMFGTAAHYVHYYLLAAVTQEDVDAKRQTAAAIVREMHFTIRTYLDKILDDVHYMQKHKPSILSASIIAVARQACEMPAWHRQLEEFTRYTVEDIACAKDQLLRDLPLPCHVDCEATHDAI